MRSTSPWRADRHLGLGRLGVLGHVGERLGDDEVGDRLDAGGRGPGRSTRSRTGNGARAARPDSAAFRPRSLSTAGCRPRMNSRISDRASTASSCASAMAWRTGSGALVKRSLAMPRFMASETSRCCAPSCRSRSIRRRSASAAATSSARLRASDSTLSASSSLGLGPSSARAAASSARGHLPGQPGRREQQPGRHRHGRGPGGGLAARGQVAERGHRGQPAGGHQTAPHHPGEHGQQVEPELPPGRRGQPRPDRPGPASARARARREVQAERGAQPDPLQRGEPLHRPAAPAPVPPRSPPTYIHAVRPAAHRPGHEAGDRGPPDQDQAAEQHAASSATEKPASAFLVARQVGGGPQRTDHRLDALGGRICRGHGVTV